MAAIDPTRRNVNLLCHRLWTFDDDGGWRRRLDNNDLRFALAPCGNDTRVSERRYDTLRPVNARSTDFLRRAADGAGRAQTEIGYGQSHASRQ